MKALITASLLLLSTALTAQPVVTTHDNHKPRVTVHSPSVTVHKPYSKLKHRHHRRAKHYTVYK